MGQRVKPDRSPRSPRDRQPTNGIVPQLSVFLTDLGWFGLLGADQVVWQLKIGHISADQVRAAFGVSGANHRANDEHGAGHLRSSQSALDGDRARDSNAELIGTSIAAPGNDGTQAHLHEADWFPELRERLQGYARGEKSSFNDVGIQPTPVTDFQRRVVAATRQLHYGQTVTYGSLAEQVGSPRAARAVGSVMAANRVPIIVPCHRVLAAGGKLGGFSAPQGVGLKERMLAMERNGLG